MADTPSTPSSEARDGNVLELEAAVDGALRVFRFDTDEPVWVGRSSKCQIHLDGEFTAASRFHARLLRRGARWVLVDQSRAGTSINGRRVDPEVEAPIKADDEIQIGPTKLRVLRAGGTDAVDAYMLTIASVDFARLDTHAMLTSAMELPESLGAAESELALYERACEYLIKALSPAVTSVHVVVADPAREPGAQVLARSGAAEGEPPVVSRRVLQTVREAADSVVFLQQIHPASGLDATVAPRIRAVGACLLEHSVEGHPIILYAVGERAVPGGENVVAAYLKLVATLTRQHLVTRRRASLTKFFSPAVVQLLMQPGARANAEGEPRVTEATSMFFDLRGFSLSSESSADDLKPLHQDLRRVMDIVTEAVFASAGTIIDYQGDGCFAAWGVPFDQPEHSAAAVRCALEIRRRLAGASLTLLGTSRRGMCGVGIACGEVLAGVVGSSAQFKYGLLGPSVNLAARLESLTKADRLDAPVLVSEEVAQRVQRAGVTTIRVARVRPAGMTRAIDAYAVCEPGSPFADPRVTAAWHHVLARLESARARADIEALSADLRSASLPSERREWISRYCRQLADPTQLAQWQGVVSFAKA